MCFWNLFKDITYFLKYLMFSYTCTHTHTHTHIYIYIYIYPLLGRDSIKSSSAHSFLCLIIQVMIHFVKISDVETDLRDPKVHSILKDIREVSAQISNSVHRIRFTCCIYHLEIIVSKSKYVQKTGFREQFKIYVLSGVKISARGHVTSSATKVSAEQVG